MLSFTIGANTNPTATQAAALITRLFKLAYGEINETYAAETAHTIIDTENVYSSIVADAQDIIEAWAAAKTPNSQNKMPRIALSDTTKAYLKKQTGKTRHITSTARLWNSDDDWSYT